VISIQPANILKEYNYNGKSILYNTKYRRYFICLIYLSGLFFGLIEPIDAQSSKGKNFVQLSGVARNELLDPIPFVNVGIKSKKRGAMSDEKGLYSIVAEKTDTVIFVSLGYKKTGFIIPDTLTTQFLSTDIILFADTVRLKAIKIYPWKTYEEFKVAFLAYKLPTTDLERAQKNLEIIQRQILLSISPDAQIAYQNSMMQNFNRMATRGQTPVNNLLNPFSWAKFIKQLRDGKIKLSNNPDE
jgi:hypothetical protein